MIPKILSGPAEKKTHLNDNILFLSGDEAVARGAYEASLHVACAYPGTPSTEILEYLSKFPQIDTQWSVNEKVAYEVAFGAAIGGARSMYASKHVGLNVAMDPFMTSVYTGVNGGFVAVVCDDPGMHSSQNEQDTRWISIFGKAPLVEPSSPSEALQFIKESFSISEKFDTPVLFRMTTRVAHSKENVLIGSREEIPVRNFSINIPKYVMVPKNAYKRHIAVEQRLRDLAQYSETTKLNSIDQGNKNLGFITSGVSYSYVKELFPDASVLKLGFVYPFCDHKIAQFASSVKELVIVEELDPFIEEHVRGMGVKFKTKHSTYRVGELRPEYLPDIRAGKPKRNNDPESTTRKPLLCCGCSHRFVFTILRELKVIITADIGCYTLGALPPLSAMHTNLCMGAGITFHEGLRRAHPEKKIIGILGDSTFIHSGITGLINAVYNKTKGLIMILDNSTTAMTGCQNNPATGRTITDQPSSLLSLENLCKSCGVDNVDVITPLKLKELQSLIKQRLAENALSVIIAREPCKLLDRVKLPAPTYKKTETCKTCGKCMSIACPNIKQTAEGYIEFDTGLCAGCNLCVDMCPSKALQRS